MHKFLKKYIEMILKTYPEKHFEGSLRKMKEVKERNWDE
jgi:hypothetical protein